MREKIDVRLQALRQEYEMGQKMLAELQAKESNLQQTMLRISGAIQVLEELLGAAPPVASNGSKPAETVASQEIQEK